MKFGSPILSPAQPFSDGQIDLLTPNALNIGGVQYFKVTGGGTPGYLASINHYKALLFYVQYQNQTVTGLWARALTPATGIVPLYSGAFNNGFFAQPSGVATGPTQQLMIGCVNNIGDIIGFDIWFSNVVSANTLLWVYGLTEIPPGLSIRGDGRNYPIGSHISSTFQNGAGTATVVNSPGVGQRLHIASAWYGSGNGQGGPNAVINGANQALVESSTAGTVQLCPVPPGGILCDPNTAITIVNTAAGINAATVLFDVVPA